MSVMLTPVRTLSTPSLIKLPSRALRAMPVASASVRASSRKTPTASIPSADRRAKTSTSRAEASRASRLHRSSTIILKPVPNLSIRPLKKPPSLPPRSVAVNRRLSWLLLLKQRPKLRLRRKKLPQRNLLRQKPQSSCQSRKQRSQRMCRKLPNLLQRKKTVMRWILHFWNSYRPRLPNDRKKMRNSSTKPTLFGKVIPTTVQTSSSWKTCLSKTKEHCLHSTSSTVPLHSMFRTSFLLPSKMAIPKVTISTSKTSSPATACLRFFRTVVTDSCVPLTITICRHPTISMFRHSRSSAGALRLATL